MLSLGSGKMKGSLFALFGGAFITLQGVANSRISEEVGTWQAATITQFTGFLASFLILLIIRDRQWRGFLQVKPLYLIGGTFAAIVIFSNVKAIQAIGATISISAILISQLTLTFIIESSGWFGLDKQRMKLPQVIGIALMIAGVVILRS
jgi:transporter family-2 protein